MEKKTWRFYFTEDDYRQMRASRMSVALQSAFDFDLNEDNISCRNRRCVNYENIYSIKA